MKTETRFDEHGLPKYLDMQARVGYTKHIGGIRSTKELLEMCQTSSDKTVLNVGCGSGATNLYLAQKYVCRSVGVDLKAGMVEAARGWARRRGLEDLVEFRQAGATALPFDDGEFDIVISESVNVFVPDQPKAMAEYRRVVKPGGMVGLNEPILLKPPSQEVEDLLDDIVGHDLFFPEHWQKLMEDAGLVDIQTKSGQVEMMEESRNQTAFFGKGDMLVVIGRMIRELFGAYTRSLLREIKGSNPKEYFEYMGYGVFVGRRG
jgi:ubiquinone/menaquinone biosynthesis C-methylase UbiE